MGGIAAVGACFKTGGINTGVGIALREGIKPSSGRALSGRASSGVYSGGVCE